MRFRHPVIAGLMLAFLVGPAMAQITVLDNAQDRPQGGEAAARVAPAGEIAATPGAQPPPCGTQPMTIARMTWPSAALLADIHARILNAEFGCEARVVPGDLAATASSMGSTGQPAVAPEMWVTRIADVWNGAIETQMVRSVAPSFAEATMEGWFIPSYMEGAFGGPPSAAALQALLSTQTSEMPVRFISCPADWACSVINRNLIAAYGLGDLVQLVEPANRFEMDALIAEAVSRRENFILYYWQPNAVLAQLEFRALDMGAYDEEAMKCLARLSCAAPKPSAFPAETVVIALAEWVFAEAPTVASYFQRATLPIAEMNVLLGQLNEPGATVEGVAERFVAARRDLWGAWVGAVP
ncbi:glycine betaine ABC transporter substrate-binding protein [Devosia sp. Root685]|uniref:glycine betaine ABC transporter substrate-binding protein n=1 Tax=Devosia sp. Root685 TaxID=1736587 RepID=UPI000B338D6D|nr:glycine betaine ABC transporter substrate-binding protein [Devosia sp. Root685]